MFSVLLKQPLQLLLGSLAATTTFVVFYLANVFALGWATSALGFGRRPFLVMQLIAVLFFGAVIPFAGLLADRIGGRNMMIVATVVTLLFGFAFEPLFGTHDSAKVLVFLILGFGLSGLNYGPLGSALATMFPTAVRYTGTSLTFNIAGILGASLAAPLATWLAKNYGLAYVGYYLSVASLITLIALLFIKNDKGGSR
jgi:nitrate/nitrite transporter NarK